MPLLLVRLAFDDAVSCESTTRQSSRRLLEDNFHPHGGRLDILRRIFRLEAEIFAQEQISLLVKLLLSQLHDGGLFGLIGQLSQRDASTRAQLILIGTTFPRSVSNFTGDAQPALLFNVERFLLFDFFDSRALLCILLALLSIIVHIVGALVTAIRALRARLLEVLLLDHFDVVGHAINKAHDVLGLTTSLDSWLHLHSHRSALVVRRRKHPRDVDALRLLLLGAN